MGRRALRKIDPTLDLSKHLRTFEQLPQPWDAAAIFGREAPLVVEVGSGKGLFMRSAAAAAPEMNFLGIEIVEKYAKFSAAALVEAESDERRDGRPATACGFSTNCCPTIRSKPCMSISPIPGGRSGTASAA